MEIKMIDYSYVMKTEPNLIYRLMMTPVECSCEGNQMTTIIVMSYA